MLSSRYYATQNFNTVPRWSIRRRLTYVFYFTQSHAQFGLQLIYHQSKWINSSPKCMTSIPTVHHGNVQIPNPNIILKNI